MAVHWEYAVSQAKGDVLTIIGDDDALMPHSLTRLNEIFLQHDDLECVTHQPGQYYWPDFSDDAWRNRYQLSRGTGALELVDTKPVLRRVAEFREWYGRLPFLYHGFVKRAVLDRIRDSYGPIFKRISPDIFSDLLLAAVMDRYARFDGCLTFGGQGAKSSGANFHWNSKEDKQFLADLPAYLVPKYYIGNSAIQLYEYVEMIGDLFPTIKANIKIPWMKFARQAIQGALGTPAHCQRSLEELQRIARNDFPVVERNLTLIAIAPFRLRWVSEMAAKVLQKRREGVRRHLKDAIQTCGAHNIYELVTRIGA